MLIQIFEFLGFITGALSVWLNSKENIWGWPIGILSVSFYAFVFFHYKLYADMCLQIIYIPLSIYGWYYWYANRGKKLLKVFEINFSLFLKVITIFFVVTPLLGILLEKYTDSELSYLDASASGLSLVAEWMLGKKFIENWLLWVVADGTFAVIYFSKDLYLTSFLYILFVLIAIYGYFRWKGKLQMVNHQNP